jgi:hypothetical protein
MRPIIILATAFVLCAGATQVPAEAKSAAKAAAFQLNETTWTYTDKGKKVRMSIDADGNYIENAVSGKHVDHGTAVMKGDKACFTSAMTKEGEVCWTTRPVKIGHTLSTMSDKGRRLKVTRVAYVKLSMPK